MRCWRFFIAATLLTFSVTSPAENGAHSHEASGKVASSSIPSAIRVEHKELHEKLSELTRIGGKTGNAASVVEKLLAPHFVKEEQWALPPLGLLPDLAAGRLPTDGTAMVRLTDHLQQEMPQMLAEHKQVIAALKQLQDAAESESKPQGVAFAKALMAHAALEEQVLYPAALLVGRFLKEKRGKGAD